MANRFEDAKEIYARLGVDVEKALETIKNVPVSVHCWQGDDVVGFDAREAASGGIQTTGNYPGKARTPEELMADMDKAFSLIPGKKKLNLHASYAIYEEGETPDRSKLEPRHFEKWVEFALERNMGIDFNPTYFSHPMVRDNFTLSSPDETVRRYWIDHTKCCLKISQYFAERTGVPCVMNIWMPDGYKDVPGSRIAARRRLKESLDEIFKIPFDREKVLVTLESKVFGIGLEACTVCSAEFCISYADSQNIMQLMDNGHYHPTEMVSDKISSMLLFNDKIALHITRPMRWDSDHVVLYDDETREIAREVVRCNALDRVFLATDFFDASINRISAWVTGVRSVQKALLFALLQPNEKLAELQDAGRMTELMIYQEDLKFAPIGDVWREYLRRENVSETYFDQIDAYEKDVLLKRN